jgi:hypothetical protein
MDASLAKLEIELIFNAIADAMPGIAKAAHPIPLRSAGSTASNRHLRSSETVPACQTGHLTPIGVHTT